MDVGSALVFKRIQLSQLASKNHSRAGQLGMNIAMEESTTERRETSDCAGCKSENLNNV